MEEKGERGKPNRMPDFEHEKMVCPVKGCGYNLDARLPFSRMEDHMIDNHPDWLGRWEISE